MKKLSIFLLVHLCFTIQVLLAQDTDKDGVYRETFRYPENPTGPGDTIMDRYIVLDMAQLSGIKEIAFVVNQDEYSFKTDELATDPKRFDPVEGKIYLPAGKITDAPGIYLMGKDKAGEMKVFSREMDELEEKIRKSLDRKRPEKVQRPEQFMDPLQNTAP